MKSIKFLSILLLIGVLSLTLANKIHAQADNSLISAELSADDITAEDLDLTDEQVKLPGSFGHWWNNFKINTQSFLTTDKTKEAKLKLKQANLEILAAKKLAGIANTDEARTRLEQALANYRQHLTSMEERLQNVPEDKKQAILEKIDEQHIKHQALFNRLIADAPEKAKEKISEVQRERIQEWYEKHKENLTERLQKALEHNEDGSNFKNLQNITSLEELKANLPEEAKIKLEAALIETQNKLRERIQNLNTADQEKLEKYLQSLPIDEIKKTEIINRLQTDDNLSPLRERLEKIKNEQLEKIRNQVKNMDDGDKELFLEKNFSDEADATKLEILNKIKNDSPALRIKIQELDEKQQQMLKERIQKTTNQQELEKLKQQLQNTNSPVLRREIEDRAQKIKLEDNSLEDDDSHQRGKDIPQIRPLNSSAVN